MYAYLFYALLPIKFHNDRVHTFASTIPAAAQCLVHICLVTVEWMLPTDLKTYFTFDLPSAESLC